MWLDNLEKEIILVVIYIDLEMALLTDQPRLATITACGKIKCATMGKKAFQRLLGPLTDLMKRHSAGYEQMS